ncbi:hypothetical protein MRX96_023197 [Rhipicephalus microplus]
MIEDSALVGWIPFYKLKEHASGTRSGDLELGSRGSVRHLACCVHCKLYRLSGKPSAHGGSQKPYSGSAWLSRSCSLHVDRPHLRGPVGGKKPDEDSGATPCRPSPLTPPASPADKGGTKAVAPRSPLCGSSGSWTLSRSPALCVCIAADAVAAEPEKGPDDVAGTSLARFGVCVGQGESQGARRARVSHANDAVRALFAGGQASTALDRPSSFSRGDLLRLATTMLCRSSGTPPWTRKSERLNLAAGYVPRQQRDISFRFRYRSNPERRRLLTERASLSKRLQLHGDIPRASAVQPRPPNEPAWCPRECSDRPCKGLGEAESRFWADRCRCPPYGGALAAAA